MGLTQIDVLNGIFSLAAVMVSIFFAIIMGARYFKYKRQELLLFSGMSIILITPWWPYVISFLYALATGSDKGIAPTLYFIIGFVFIPIGLLMWLRAFTILIKIKQPKLLLTIGVLYLIVYETALFYMIFFNHPLIGKLDPPINVHYNYGLVAIFFPGVIIVFVTGYLFCRESLRSDSPEIRLRGKLIFTGLTLFVGGAHVAALLSTYVIFMILSRILMIISGFVMYIGLIMPNWVKRFFKINIAQSP